ncbi:2'-5' RNA ligase family protein [Leifsonia sp. 2MCAF36]|uniref:2'-5' RNA ligase family protein n=1 Tax=Leifsonia sp. 2MCAF36 TaxID=3232988 RepID=UPI003F95B5D6
MSPDEFPATDWPLHVTVVPPFETELAADQVAALVPLVPPIPIAGATRERFGTHGTVPVTVLRGSAALVALHTSLVDALDATGATLRDQRHIRADFRAHATDQRRGRLHPGEHALLTELCIVARAPGGLRRVAARVPLPPA